MGNKTIYFKDDDLWERARELAGKDGISAVIQTALARFVSEKEQEALGFRRFRLESGFKDEPEHNLHSGTTERIAFDGLLLVEQVVPVAAAEGDGEDAYELQFRLYRTRGGNLVFTVAEADDMFGVGHHAVYRSLSTLREDEYLQKADAVARAEFLDKCSAQLGEEWAVWID